ncbi:MAG: outer membrane beta-barrel protein [Sedimentisphaerales bacterium]|nr:outer membrane beta-barrel protein [Sedimentisphaerales bacterium]
MSRTVLALMAFGALLATANLRADVEKGDQEQDVLLGFGCTAYDEFRREGSSNDYLVQYGRGYFFTDNLSAGLRIGGQWIDDGFYPEWALNGGPYVKWNFFTHGDWVPYVGLQLHYWLQKSNYFRPFSTDTNQGIMYGPMLGIRYYLNEGTFLMAEYQYRWFCCDAGQIAEGSNAGLIGFGFTY